MSRTLPPVLALLLGILLSLPTPAQQPPTPKSPTSQPTTLPDTDLFPQVPNGTVYTKPQPKPPVTPATPPATRPAPKPAPTPLPPPTPAPAPAPSSFHPTHRITLTTGRILEGIPTTPTATSPKVTIKLELGSIEVPESEIQKIEPIK